MRIVFDQRKIKITLRSIFHYVPMGAYTLPAELHVDSIGLSYVGPCLHVFQTELVTFVLRKHRLQREFRIFYLTVDDTVKRRSNSIIRCRI